mmetsp:Transcript_7943/g.28292  ORF Transcript_7943/g.28292 Transcript_7943/m.28292 type:complete len:358 (+) Transcript_7943:18-1091(+)
MVRGLERGRHHACSRCAGRGPGHEGGGSCRRAEGGRARHEHRVPGRRPHVRRGGGGRRRRRPARGHGPQRARLQDGVRLQAVPDAVAHRGGAGRHQRRAGQHDGGRLAVAHVRHRQGLRLARRPGRHPLHVPRGAARRRRARVVRAPVLAHGGRQDLPARLRRPVARLRQGRTGVPVRSRGRPHGPRHAAHAVRPLARLRHALLHRVLRAGPHHGRRGRVPRRAGDGHGGRHAAPHQGQEHGARDGRLRPRLLLRHLGAHLHGRRQRHGAARRPVPRGPGVRAVPPDGHLRRWLPHDRGLPRRGRHPQKQRGRALHGAVRAVGQGPGVARRREPRDDDGDPRGPRRRAQEGPHLPAP